jgi:hypothetical protein
MTKKKNVKTKGICKLCETFSVLVDSHIIPKSFYGKWAKEKMIAISSKTRQRTGAMRNGLYGQFLCNNCEIKYFNSIDNFAAQMIKQKKSEKIFYKIDSNEEKFQVGGILTTVEDVQNIHVFAASILWRAIASERKEYEYLWRNLKPKVGVSNNSLINIIQFEELTQAIRSGNFNKIFLDQFGLLLMFYDGSEDDADAAHASFRLISPPVNIFSKEVGSFTQTFGYFSCLSFGFPQGEIFMRYRGEKPKQGYLDIGGNKTTLWSCNISDEYPHWFTPTTQMINKNGFVSNPILKDLLDNGMTAGFGGV